MKAASVDDLSTVGLDTAAVTSNTRATIAYRNRHRKLKVYARPAQGYDICCMGASEHSHAGLLTSEGDGIPMRRGLRAAQERLFPC